MLALKVIDRNGKTAAVSRGEKEVNLVVSREYQEGDSILLEPDEPGFLWLQVDDALGKSLVYATGLAYYKIPFGEQRTNISPKAFWGSKHLVTVRKARDFEVKTYRNLAYNVNDQHGLDTLFPHASANIETRGESVFAAQNAIDGVTANESHGEWPYASWGINRDPKAVMKLDFGREVEVDRIVIHLRADFPHDNWWKTVRITFSDGETMELKFRKTGEGQEFTFEKKKITGLEFSHMSQSEEPSPFPALTQIEVYGTDL